jgi:hypothetical protein
MRKTILLISIILFVASCKSSKTNCDAYGYNHTHKKEHKLS